MRDAEGGSGPTGDVPAFPGLSRVTPLGTGGMGSVFRARQDDLGRDVAVKTLRSELTASAELRERFAREAHVLARLDHPGIVPVYLAGETERGPYYVMRLVEGEPVDRHLAGAPAVQVAEVFRDIAAALAASHREGVLHRDVKPANVLVEPSGRAILVDFGLSTQELAGGRADEKEPGLVGTPDYLAPEVLDGEPYSRASDVYALGATLYLVLAGRVPFPAADLAEKLRAIREDDPPPPRALAPSVPRPLQAICLKAMERSPRDRYASADELRRDLERFLAGDPVEALPVRSRSLLRRKLERHLEDHAEWERLGLVSERQRLALRIAYERLDEEERSLLKGVLPSLPNLLFVAGLILSVFGPLVLQVSAWDGLGPAGRVALPAVPLALLGALGAARWRARDRRRGLACLLGAALLLVPAAFALVDLVPALRAVVDAEGGRHAVLPGPLWQPGEDDPAWMQAGSRLLAWKVLGTSLLVLVPLGLLYRSTRAALFLWLIGPALSGAVVPAARLSGWWDLPLVARWLLESGAALGLVALGLPLERAFRRDRALPFYALGFLWVLTSVVGYASQGMPALLVGAPAGPAGIGAAGGSFVVHGLAIAGLGLLVHFRGTALLSAGAGAPLVAGFLFTHAGLADLAAEGGWVPEILLVAAGVGFLVLGLALHRNTLVLPAAVLLPFTVGNVSQRHVDALWAWSVTLVLTGLALVLLALRLAARRSRPARGSPGRAGAEADARERGA